MKGSSVHLLYLLSYLSSSREKAGIEPATQCFKIPKYDPKTTLDYFTAGHSAKQKLMTE
jgi:hypothetical protein